MSFSRKIKKNIGLSPDTYSALKAKCEEEGVPFATRLKDQVRTMLRSKPLYGWQYPEQPIIWRTLSLDEYGYRRTLELLPIPEQPLFETAARQILNAVELEEEPETPSTYFSASIYNEVLYYLTTVRGDDHVKLTLTLGSDDFMEMERRQYHIMESLGMHINVTDLIPVVIAMSHMLDDNQIDLMKIRFTDNEKKMHSLGRIGLKDYEKMGDLAALSSFYVRHAYPILKSDYDMLAQRVERMMKERPSHYKFGISSFVRQAIHLVDYDRLEEALEHYYKLHHFTPRRMAAALL
jgi:hypothetical protein